MDTIYYAITFFAMIIVIIMLFDKALVKRSGRYVRLPFRYGSRYGVGCRCYEQPVGNNRGFCGQYINGTLYGCPGGCRRNCSRMRFR